VDRFRDFARLARSLHETGAGGGSAASRRARVGTSSVAIHKAKGLEFPVVVVADPGDRQRAQEDRFFVDPGSRSVNGARDVSRSATRKPRWARWL